MRHALLTLAAAALMAIPASAQITGQVNTWISGTPTTSAKEKALPHAVVLIGRDLRLDIGSRTDTVHGTVLAKLETDDRGRFTANVPPGKYVVILWKTGFVPQVDRGIAAPGSYDGNISKDSAGRGAHQELAFR